VNQRSYACRDCQDDTPSVSRICADCRLRRRKKRNREMLKACNIDAPSAVFVSGLTEPQALRVIHWLSGRRELLEQIEGNRICIRNRCSTYGIKVGHWMLMLVEQHGLCGICRRDLPPLLYHVDHDHETGVVRGLLCPQCNYGLGQLGIDGAGAMSRIDDVRGYITKSVRLVTRR
jgi:hypothetical protein